VHISSTQKAIPKVRHQVSMRFDGESIRSVESGQGEKVHGTVFSARSKGDFDPASDQVLLLSEPGEKVTADSLTGVEGALGKKNWDNEGLKELGLTFAFDRNNNGKLEVNRGKVGTTWNKLKNAVNEGNVMYSGKETVTVGEKEAAAQAVFKTYEAKLNAQTGEFQGHFRYDAAGYKAYSQHFDKQRMIYGGVGLAGLGTFFAIKSMETASKALVLTGVTGLTLGATCLLAAAIVAKQDADLPVAY
jgi:hypothetical protein